MHLLFVKTYKFALALAALSLLSGAVNSVSAQARGTEAIREIQFKRGQRTATLTGVVSLPHGEGDMHNDGADRYTLRYRAGQRVTITLASESDRAGFSIANKEHEALDLPAGAKRWSGKLPSAGDYIITILTEVGMAKYTLRVTLR